VVVARLQVFEELIHHEQQSLVREFLAERGHHLLEGILVVQFLIRRPEREIHAELLEEAFELLGDDLAQRHFQTADFDAQHLEAPGDGRTDRKPPTPAPLPPASAAPRSSLHTLLRISSSESPVTPLSVSLATSFW
jgi:hypothetical protein